MNFNDSTNIQHINDFTATTNAPPGHDKDCHRTAKVHDSDSSDGAN